MSEDVVMQETDNTIDQPPPSKKLKSSSSSSSSKPASTIKPKSKPQRPRSPSPTPPPPPPPPLQTIRLQINLGGPDNYEVDIATLAKTTGQRQPTPPPPKADTSDSEGEDDGEPKKKKKKHATSEYYDVNDPFIDDSELNIDNRTHFAQTKQQGFYVSSGEVALMKDSRTPKKPKSKKVPVEGGAAAGPSKAAIKEDGTKEHPISLLGEDKGNKKRKNYTVIEENGKKRKVVDIRDFHPELQLAIEDLKSAIAKESWDVKGKFPPSIKPLLADFALKAVNLGEYDDDFFNLMPVLFPYNRYTMTKLIKRTIFTDHLKILTDRQDELLQQLAGLTKEGFSKAQEEWEKSVVAWERRKEKAKNESEAGAASASTPSASVDAAHPDDGTVSGVDGDNTRADGDRSLADGAGTDGGGPGPDGDNAPGTNKADGTRDAHPPAQKYRLTEAMKVIVWQLVMLSNECCRLENEKNDLDGSNALVSEQGTRKILYQKIVAAFPSGWLNSGQLSREVSSLKKKYEKETMEQEN
ncbi:uncharacterized protein F5891DRAFT_1041851 [Suillus fuscotomentosus]|uniref:Ubinuclein middle domain-containing protein n=1 Tax=Suillus fuscotomentosus TaxID=1912939 RepID=A0AAD4HJI1_9AGAM|nr:uncharacterized protein F5891DRAFT_1041851 [Suillus fuscotomentosus]KAG1898903.1 hypothetical protein F5891DRAFT_1041851 [Suillus fuscotomentosus]